MTTNEIPVRVKQMRYEADTVLSVDFEALDGEDLPDAKPGAHIDVLLRDDLRRSYSLTRASSRSPVYTVAIHRDPKSRGGSDYVHGTLRVGDRLRISRPRNNFELDESAEVSVLIAGGIGITPILAMIRHLVDRQKVWTLYYAARRRSSAAFLEEISALEAKSSGKGRVFCHFDDQQGGALLDLATILKRDPEAHFYCCGPEPMLAAYEAAARDVPRSQVHLEYFSSTEEIARDGGFEIVLNRSGKTLTVEPGQTILDVLIANNVSVPFSCTEGTCGTCETGVIEGRPDHRDVILSEEERAENKTMMVCCSGSRSARLVLDL